MHRLKISSIKPIVFSKTHKTIRKSHRRDTECTKKSKIEIQQCKKHETHKWVQNNEKDNEYKNLQIFFIFL